MKTAAFLFILSFGAFSTSAWALVSSPACELSSGDADYRKISRSEYLYEISLGGQVLVALPHQNFKSLEAFRRQVRARVGDVDPMALLRRQRKFYESFPEEAARFDRVLSGEWGHIAPLSCLEAFLFDVHIRRFGGFSEFQAVILRHPQEDRVKVLVVTQGLEDMVRTSPDFEARIKRRLRQGWTMETHMHNHPFSFDNPYGDVAGTIIPSGADLNLYERAHRNHGLKFARVLNGFDALLIPAQTKTLVKSQP